MRQSLVAIVVAVSLAVGHAEGAAAHSIGVVNSHCTASGGHSEGTDGADKFATAWFQFNNTSDRYAVCDWIRVEMNYAYWGSGGSVWYSRLTNYAYPGSYPFSSSDDLMASVTAKSNRVIGCSTVRYTIKVGVFYKWYPDSLDGNLWHAC